MVSGVPVDKIRSLSSAVDKLDKAPWAEMKKEMMEKGLSNEVADKIGEYVRRGGGVSEILEVLKSDPELCANNDLKAGGVVPESDGYRRSDLF